MAIDVGKVLKDKKFWIASLLVAWAAGLQWHMAWMKKQDAFKQKFGTPDAKNGGGEDDTTPEGHTR